MTAVRTAADVHPDPAARADARIAVLRELAQIGLRAARSLEREIEAAVSAPPADADGQAQAAAPARRADEIARALAQVARAVSLAVALEEKIDQDRARGPLEAEALVLKRRVLAARVADHESDSLLTRRRALVGNAVEQAIEADPSARSPGRAADLRTRLDRLLACEAADFDAFLHRPAGEIVARICRDLGLDPDWTLWDAPWAAQAGRAAAQAPARAAVRRGPPPPTPGGAEASPPIISSSFPGGGSPRVRPPAGPIAGFATADPGTQPHRPRRIAANGTTALSQLGAGPWSTQTAGSPSTSSPAAATARSTPA